MAPGPEEGCDAGRQGGRGQSSQEKKQALAVCEAQVIWEDAGPCAVQSPSPCCVCPPPTVGASIRVADATPACRALDLVSLGGS